MKSLLLFICSIPIISFAKVIEYDKSTYTEVVFVDSVSKDDLYTRARYWFATAFKSANYVIQMEDSGTGKIIGKGAIGYKSETFKPSHNGWILFTYTVKTMDGRFRILVENIRHESSDDKHNGGSFDNERPACGTARVSLSQWGLLKEKRDGDILNFVDNMKAEMRKKDNSSDNW